LALSPAEFLPDSLEFGTVAAVGTFLKGATIPKLPKAGG
jgi:hypothetical protein